MDDGRLHEIEARVKQVFLDDETSFLLLVDEDVPWLVARVRGLDAALRGMAWEIDGGLCWCPESWWAMEPDTGAQRADDDHSPECVAARAVLAGETAGEPKGKRITHGRHCTCSACRQENWANPRLAACGMHGPSCPPVYAPLGAAGQLALSAVSSAGRSER